VDDEGVSTRHLKELLTMSKGKYVIPVIMGQPGSELFLVKGEIPRGQSMVLVRLTSIRALAPKDTKALDKLLEKSGSAQTRPTRVKELNLITPENINEVSAQEATLVHGYIMNLLPGAFKAPEMQNWYIFERPGDITSLKMARFAINLLERSEKVELLGAINQLRVSNAHPKFAAYR
jgi:hypothetical protein